ncbi:MAG TPA: hypothetical protein VME69_15540 [Methylocella sp.]|nr:hypothetical protein [Methylocella sp.]
MRRFRVVMRLMFALAAIATPVVSMAQFVSITVAPPVLPVYVQPPIPAPGYIWTPGYWAYGPLGYFWVPGTWVAPPAVGLLWTPGYWGWNNGVYAWNAGYWGPHIGFYGGVNYGFGYGGVGYQGGYWNNGTFSYNQSVNNIGSVAVTNVYNKTVINNTSGTQASFNGGPGGTTAQPTPQEQAAASERHVAATAAQTEHEHTASTNKALLASVNHGRPAIAATSRPGEFSGKGVVPATDGKPGTPGPKMTDIGKGNPTMNTGSPSKPLTATPQPSKAPARVPAPNPQLKSAAKPHPTAATARPSAQPAAKPAPAAHKGPDKKHQG